MNRIDEKFSSLGSEKKRALITFVTAGDPDLDTTIDAVSAMEKGGADIIEIGIPYSDPLADGPTIQASSARALKNGVRIPKVMKAVRRIREKSEVPLVFLVYYNSVFRYGIESFLDEAAEAGIDGMVVPDLPLEERADMMGLADERELSLIPLVAPTSHERIEAIVGKGRGFVYCVSVAGVTGMRKEISTDLEGYMETVSGFTSLPRAIGFGISGPEMIERVKPYCEGVIVGSAIVRRMARDARREDLLEDLENFVSELKSAL